eukprot:1288498-Pleurochrysis_carterae.AAC.1
MPPAAAIATWLSALNASLRSAAAAFSLALLVPLRPSSTKGPKPPAAAIATWLSALKARL